MNRPGSLYVRLVIPLAMTLLVAMLAAWAIAAQLLTTAFDRRVDEQLDHAITILANSEFPFSAAMLSRFDRLIEARIALLDQDGTVRLSSTDGPTNNALTSMAIQFRSMNIQGLHLMTSEAGGKAWRIAVRPISPERDSRFRYVVAAAPLDETREAARDAAMLLGTAMLLATILLAWFGSVFTRSITKPISDLASMADKIAEGERDLSSNYVEKNEIGQLAGALNEMARRLKQYEAELSQQSRLAGLGDLAARLAHEIRNPLTVLKMQLQLLEESVPEQDIGRVRTLLNEIRRMELIVESALTVGAPLVLNISGVKVDEIIADLSELLKPTLQHRNIELQSAVSETAEIEADPDRLKQVLLNLINNAADELDEGGIIRLTATITDGGNSMEIGVEDSGPGFQQDADQESRSKPFGLGLGLTICREIIDQHKGELSIGSSPDLGGAKFTIRLPAPTVENSPQAD